MNINKDLLYSKSHEWVKINNDGTATIGITDYAQNALGDIVYINLCEAGTKLEAESILGDVESIKAVSDIYTPLGGTVTEVNAEAGVEPAKINAAPYETWLIKIENISDKSNLMTPEQYEEELKKIG